MPFHQNHGSGPASSSLSDILSIGEGASLPDRTATAAGGAAIEGCGSVELMGVVVVVGVAAAAKNEDDTDAVGWVGGGGGCCWGGAATSTSRPAESSVKKLGRYPDPRTPSALGAARVARTSAAAVAVAVAAVRADPPVEDPVAHDGNE
jgi:hypothetical protein